jgi:hypothetical protein
MRNMMFACLLLVPSTGLADVLGTPLACKRYELGGTQAVYTAEPVGKAAEDPDDANLLIDNAELIGFEFVCKIGDGVLLRDEIGDGDEPQRLAFAKRDVNKGVVVTIADDPPVTLAPCQ